MSTGGWIIMTLSVGGVTCFFAWCLWRVLRDPQSGSKLQSPAVIETPDADS